MSKVFGVGTKSPLAILGGALLLTGTACTIHSNPPPPAPPPPEPRVVYVEQDRAEPVTVVPTRIERYPHTSYRGRVAYYVNGRWYYDSRDRGWVVFRDEPRELARFRTGGGIYVESSVPREPPPVMVYGSRADMVSGPPAGWERSTRVRYRDGDAFYVGGRWYYRSSAYGWVVLRDEPRELYESRRGGPLRLDGYVVERTSVPRFLNRYPRVPYNGSEAYLVDGRWYTHTAEQGWVVFREEPRELSRRRVELRR